MKQNSNYLEYKRIKTSSNINESSSNNKSMSYKSKYTIKENIQNNKIVKNSTIFSYEELLGIMNNFFSENESEKLETIIIIHEIFCSNYQQNKFILIPNIDNIIKIFIQITHELFIHSIDMIRNKIYLKFAKYLVTILCKLTANKELIIHISYKVLYDLCYELLNYLLIDGLDKIGSIYEGNIIFKSINSSMLRVIENCDTTSVILVLLEIIKQNKNNIILSNLAIKCLLKTTENIESIINSLKLDKILLQMHLIIYNLYKLSKNKIEQNSMIIKFIKNFVIDIVIIKKEEIIEDYNKSFANSQYKDNYIYIWIKNALEIVRYSMTEKNKELNKDRDKNSNNKIKTKKMNSVDKTFNCKLNKLNSKMSDYNIKTKKMHSNSFDLNLTESSLFESSKKVNKNNLDN